MLPMVRNVGDATSGSGASSDEHDSIATAARRVGSDRFIGRVLLENTDVPSGKPLGTQSGHRPGRPHLLPDGDGVLAVPALAACVFGLYSVH